jgi:endonuclease YncB( thermonuclease family)
LIEPHEIIDEPIIPRDSSLEDCEMMNSRFKILWFAIIFFILAISSSFPDGQAQVEAQLTFPLSSQKTYKDKSIWSGMVAGVPDADVIMVLHEGTGEQIRLYGIDAPDIGQPFDKRAKQFTSDMVSGRTVEVETKNKDQDGRTVGIVTVDGKSLNEALIRNGLAWVYRTFCKDPFCKSWIDLEVAARHDKIGLWSEPNPIPPWVFRHEQ